MPRLLQHGIQVHLMAGEHGCEGCDDPRAVTHYEAHILGRLDVLRELTGRDGNIVGERLSIAAVSGGPQKVGDYRYCGGIAAGAISPKAGFATELSRADDQVLAARNLGER